MNNKLDNSFQSSNLDEAINIFCQLDFKDVDDLLGSFKELLIKLFPLMNENPKRLELALIALKKQWGGFSSRIHAKEKLAAVNKTIADEYAEIIKPDILSIIKEGYLSYNAIAIELNNRKVPTFTQKLRKNEKTSKWSSQTVKRILERLGIDPHKIKVEPETSNPKEDDPMLEKNLYKERLKLFRDLRMEREKLENLRLLEVLKKGEGASSVEIPRKIRARKITAYKAKIMFRADKEAGLGDKPVMVDKLDKTTIRMNKVMSENTIKSQDKRAPNKRK